MFFGWLFWKGVKMGRGKRIYLVLGKFNFDV